MPHLTRPALTPPPATPAVAEADLATAAKRLLPRLSAWRRHLHRRPELGGSEIETTRWLAYQLAVLGWRTQPLVHSTGLLATLPVPVAGGAAAVALRAEIDGLPVDERSGEPFSSEVPGIGHLCGHDAHMAMALGAAALLAERRGRLTRRVKIVFQPGGHGADAARAVAHSAALDDVAGIIALHVHPGLPTGTVGLRAGTLTAASDHFSVVIRGKGGHGAAPDLCIDPILIAAHCINTLQTVVARNADPAEAAVLTVAHVRGGTAFNVIPGEAKFGGTMRSLSPDVRRLLHRRLAEVVNGVADAHGGRAEIDIRAGHPPVFNDAGTVERVAAAVESVFGDRARIASAGPLCTAEDFAHYLGRRPGALVLLGTGNAALETTHPCHSPQFRLDEDALPVGAAVLAGYCLA